MDGSAIIRIMGWNHSRGWRRRRFKADADIPSGPNGTDTIEAAAMAGSAYVVLVIAVVSAGVFAALSRQPLAPLEAPASASMDAGDAARATAAPHDEAVDRSRERK